MKILSMSELNYDQDVQIDENALDVEWLKQPSLMIKYARFVAEARKLEDIARERLEFIRAKLDQKIRKDPEGYGLSKITETAIQNCIVQQPEYIAANREASDARYEYDIAKGVVQAIDHRKSALENLVKLHGQQYFAGPTAPRDLTKEMERKRQSRTDEKVSKVLKRSK